MLRTALHVRALDRVAGHLPGRTGAAGTAGAPRTAGATRTPGHRLARGRRWGGRGAVGRRVGGDPVTHDQPARYGEGRRGLGESSHLAHLPSETRSVVTDKRSQ